MMRRADRYFIQQQLGEMNLKESTFAQRPTLLGAQLDSPSTNSSIPPGKMPKKKTVKPLAHWTPNLMPVRVKRWMPLGTRLGRPQLSGTAEGTAPCTGSALGCGGNFGGPRIDASVFPCSGKLPRRMLSLTGDWCSEIEDALEHGHNAAKVKEVMFASLEGMARDNAKMIDENRDLHVTRILDGLDSLYGVSMTFQSLNTALCSLQQR